MRIISSMVLVWIMLHLCSYAHAATINVGGQCTLSSAIVSANSDASQRDFCVPGSGADRIVLPRNSQQLLRTVNNTNLGPAGLPTIRSPITIGGNGSVIRRSPRAPKFRIFSVDQFGILRLQKVTVSGGADPVAGGIYCSRGRVYLTQSSISDNVGDGVSADDCVLGITNGVITRNQGLGIYGLFTDLNMLDSTVSNNAGTSVFIQASYDYTITNSTLSNNKFSGAGIAIGELRIFNSTISSNGYGVGVEEGTIYLVGTTITRNRGVGAGASDGGIFFNRTIVSGNGTGGGPEARFAEDSGGGAGAYNIFGHSGRANLVGFVPAGHANKKKKGIWNAVIDLVNADPAITSKAAWLSFPDASETDSATLMNGFEIYRDGSKLVQVNDKTNQTYAIGYRAFERYVSAAKRTK